MHSSRMRTTRSLTYGGGGVSVQGGLSGGVSVQGGLSGESLSRGSLLGGSLSGRVSLTETPLPCEQNHRQV